MSTQVLAPALIIRKGCCDDVAHMLPLMRQLRYPTTSSVLKERLAMLEEQPLFGNLVAELDGIVVGTAFLKQYQTHDMKKPVTRITALIVDEAHRASGIGRRLIEEAERWARSRGSSELILSTAGENHRSVKAFYEHCGFRCAGYRMNKLLSEA
ncbi:GNAT family N-acetyltransferase [Paenibacillus sanguinis]|uniref:GNAT family N-acetyltransferase n=1 Tax=Paenibacillus sanguinis TaxID=225906 RepID=UPI00036239D4|nr:GNAT family N-acetyltransferase [Paenibacillus sanguinis]